MSKISRVLYLIAGSVFTILIGALHTFVHFQDLVKPEVQKNLQQEIMIMGESQTMWNTWGIMSFMMGMSFIVIGLLNIHIFNQLSKDEYPPSMGILAMVIYLLSVIYVGYEFAQAPQLYGGFFGLILISICGLLKLKNK